MLKLIKGCKVPKAELLCEQYEKCEHTMIANVNADKIEDVFRHFIAVQTEPLFFILELPASAWDEQRLRTDDTSPTHKDVYYIDGLDKEYALLLLERYGALLIHDGISRFGFGVHDNSAELMLDKYNVMTLWTNAMERYADFFESHNILCTEKCITAWDIFSAETPGTSEVIRMEGKSVFDLPEELADWGIYLAKQQEDQ